MSFSDLLDRFPSLSAVVAGDLMLDQYIFGRATRISPEAPVMVVRQTATRSVPGGAANVARNVRALGARAHVAGLIGDDDAGRLLAKMLSSDSQASLTVDPARTTTTKTRVLADHAHQVLRIDHEVSDPPSPAVEEELLGQTRRAMQRADVLILSDYLKGALPGSLVRALIEDAKARGIPVVANPKPGSLASYQGSTLVSLNRGEAANALGEADLETDRAIEAASSLRRESGAESLIITLGEDGVAVAGPQSFLVPAPKVEVYDTAGAGDTVIAAIALGLAASGFSQEVFSFAVHAGAAVVRKVGVATPSEQDLAQIRSLA